MKTTVAEAPVRRIFRIVNGSTPSSSEPTFWDGDIPWATPEDLGTLNRVVLSDTRRKLTSAGYLSCGTTMVSRGSLVLSTRAPIGNVAIAGVPLCTNQGCKCLVPLGGADTRFFYYVLLAESQSLQSLGQGSTFRELSSDQLAAFRVPLPDPALQIRIAAFLDRRTAAIDKLVDLRLEFAGLLDERIRNAASSILASANGPVTKLAYCVDLLPGFAFPSEGFLRDHSGVRLLRGVNVGVGCLRWDDTVAWPTEDARSYERYRLRSGDVVLGMDRPWVGGGIRVAEVRESDLPALLLQRVARLRAKQSLRQAYLLLALASDHFREYFEPILTGVSVPHISPSQILDFRLRLPSIAEQDSACRRYRALVRSTERLADRLDRQLAALREYRQALISAAVTGKIDVSSMEAA